MSKRTNETIPSLTDYRLLGRSGLRVSPLCLGTMTFGTETGWGGEKKSWGADEKTSGAIFRRYLEAGGNFIDTADGYTKGHSEEIVGRLIRETNSRDQVVLATKFTFGAQPGNPNGGGNGRKNLYRALEASLRRLQTDYVDLYWLHAYDGLTPIEEVVNTLDDLVRHGKVRYIGFSDVPAWYLARGQTLAEVHNHAPISALQLEYSLVERNIEREHVPAALEMGMGICPWSPLGGGLLTGKYRRRGKEAEGEGRLQVMREAGQSAFDKFTERNWAIHDALLGAARELDRPPAQVALNWIAHRPAVSSTLVGATRLEQLEENLQALEFELPEGLAVRLEQASRPELVFPYRFFQPEMQAMFNGGVTVRAEPPGFRGRQG